MSTLSLAWRNIWRNGRRTVITATALGLGVAAIVVVVSMTAGMFDRMIGVATRAMSGDAQIHATGYRETRDERLVLADPPLDAARALTADGRPTAAAPRVFGTALVAIGDRSQGVRLIGVDPAAERQVTHWAERLADGRYLQDPGEVMVGADLARKMELELGTRLVATMADIETGEARAEALRIVGVLSTGDTTLDAGAVIVDIGLARRMMGLGARAAHEVALALPIDSGEQARVDRFVAPLAAGGREVVAWHVVNPAVSTMVDLQVVYLGIFIGVVFLIVAFGIINTLAMSLAERRHEFGVLRAIGTSPRRLAGLVLCEAGSLGLVGAVPGALIGVALTLWLGHVGLDMTGVSQSGVTFTDPLYPVLDPIDPIWIAALFTALTTAVAGFSAWRTGRIEPVEAMRR